MIGGCIGNSTIRFLGVWVESKERKGKIEETTWDKYTGLASLCAAYIHYIVYAWSKHQICLCRTLFKLIGWVKIIRDFTIFFYSLNWFYIFEMWNIYLSKKKKIPFLFSTLFNLKIYNKYSIYCLRTHAARNGHRIS